MSKYAPMVEIDFVIRKRAKEIHSRSKSSFSVWNYDETSGIITIYTNAPGYWVGQAGRDITELINSCRKLVQEREELMRSRGYDDYKLKPFSTINLIECNA